jgi:hypothetical protein
MPHMVDCQQVREMLTKLAEARDPIDPETDQLDPLRQHIQDCQECQAEMEEFQRFSEEIREALALPLTEETLAFLGDKLAQGPQVLREYLHTHLPDDTDRSVSDPYLEELSIRSRLYNTARRLQWAVVTAVLLATVVVLAIGVSATEQNRRRAAVESVLPLPATALPDLRSGREPKPTVPVTPETRRVLHQAAELAEHQRALEAVWLLEKYVTVQEREASVYAMLGTLQLRLQNPGQAKWAFLRAARALQPPTTP